MNYLPSCLFSVMVKRGAQMSHQTSEYSPSSTYAYAEFLGSCGQTASTTKSSGSKPINYLHPCRSAKGNGLGSDILSGRIRAASHDRPQGKTVGTHLLRWHRTESGGEGLSVVYALHKSEKT